MLLVNEEAGFETPTLGSHCGGQEKYHVACARIRELARGISLHDPKCLCRVVLPGLAFTFWKRQPVTSPSIPTGCVNQW